MKYKLIDLSLVAFFIILGGYHLFLLLSDEFDAMAVIQGRRFGELKEEPLAYISKKENIVKVKGNEHIAFNEAIIGTSLISDDQIFTHENALATITFVKDGGIISLLGNTLFKIREQDGETEIDLKSGTFFAKLGEASSAIKLKLNGQELKIEGKNAEVAISQDDKKSRISLIHGKAKVSSLKAGLIDLKENQSLEKNDEGSTPGSFQVKNFEVVLERPISQFVKYFYDEVTLNFKWHGDDSYENEIILSKNSEFSKIIKKEKLDAGVSEVTISLDEGGIYFWKVIQTKNEDIKESQTYTLSLFEEREIRLLSPLDDFSFIYLVGKGSDQFINFRWEEVSGVQDYNLRIFIDGEDDKEIKVKGNYFALKVENFLIGKDVEWQVKIDSPDHKEALWSKKSSFKIDSVEIPEPPVIVLPFNDTEKTYYDVLESQIEIEFEKVKDINSYELLIVNKENHDEVLLKENIKDNTFNYPVKKSGVFGIKVRSLDPYKRETRYSEERIIKIEINEVKKEELDKGQKVVIKKPTDQVTFNWNKTSEKGEMYIFELSKLASFNEIVMSRKAQNPEVKVVIPEVGVFFWRTKIVNLNNPNKVIYSPPKKVEIMPAPPPSAPVLPEKIEIKIEEAKNKSFLKKTFDFVMNNIIGIPISNATETPKKRKAEIKWNKNEDAKLYLIEIYDEDDELILKEKVSKNSFTWINPKEGNYKWRLSYIDYFDREGPFSEFSKLSVTLPEELREIKKVSLLSPRDEEVFEFEASENQEITFEWEKEGNVNSVLKISLDPNTQHKVLYQKDLANKESEIVNFNNKIPQGTTTLYWQVDVYNKFGKLKKSDIRNLSIKINKIKSEQNLKKEGGPTFLSFYYGYSQNNYEGKVNTDVVKLSGNTVTNFSLLFEKYYQNFLLLDDFSYNRGKVFNDEEFSYLKNSLNLEYKFISWNQTLFYSGIGATFVRLSDYKIEDQKVKLNSTVSAIAPSVSIGVQAILFKKMKNFLTTDIYFGSVSGFQSSYMSHFFINKSMALGGKLSYQIINIDKISNSNVGILFSFLNSF